VAFYGPPVDPPAQAAIWPKSPTQRAAEMKAPVLGLYGEANQGIPVAQVEAMKAALTAAGKIALIDVTTPALSRLFQYLMFTRKSGYPDESADFNGSMSTPLLGGTLKAAGVDLKAAARAGVLGVICVWRGCSEENARNQYLPFTTPYQGCPALWVGSAAGNALQAAAEQGVQAQLTLEAHTTEQASTDTLFAVLPGANAAETIIINTHTDGPNACEENGGAGVVALARYFSGRPAKTRRPSKKPYAVDPRARAPERTRSADRLSPPFPAMASPPLRGRMTAEPIEKCHTILV